MSSLPERPKIAESVSDLIGRTPLLRLRKLADEAGVVANILLKLESMEPCSSVKDRLARGLFDGAESRGEITPGETVIVEPTSGNTGIGMAMVAASRGYKIILTMPAQMSLERRVMLMALGAQLVLTPPEKGMKGAIAKANEIVASLDGKGRILGQFTNSDNPKIHRETTGPEIWDQTDGNIDIFISGVGTGGTLTGTTQFLRSVKPDVVTIAVEPAESPVLSGGQPGPHKIQGIGAGFIPDNCHVDLINEVVTVTSDLAIATAREAATKEGVFVGISSGAAIAAALRVGSRPENAGKTIVAIIPSFGERYLSTALFADVAAAAQALQPEPVTV